MQDGASGKIVPPITVTAIADRVVACNWCIRAFTPTARNTWSFFFPSFYTQALERYPFLEDQGRGLSGLRNGYLLPEKRTDNDLLPETGTGTDLLPESGTGTDLLPEKRTGTDTLPEKRTGAVLLPQWLLESDHLTYALPMQQGGD